MAYNKETEMYEGYIYLILNDIHPEKIYVGQTYDTPQARWGSHIFQVKHHEDTDKLHNAISKYGIQHFVMEVICNYKHKDKKELIKILDSEEIRFISRFDSYHNGYNSTKGGRGASEHQMRPVKRYSLYGEFIQEYESVNELKKEFDSVSTIYDCCKYPKKFKYAYGAIWRYSDDNTPLPVLNEKELYEAFNRYFMLLPIKKYDYRGNYICTYKNRNELLKNENVTAQQLYKCCTGTGNWIINFSVYRFSHDDFNTYRVYRNKPKLVEQYTLNGEFMNVYLSTRDAGRKNNLLYTDISLVCRHKKIECGGYIWRYVNDPDYINEFYNKNKENKNVEKKIIDIGAAC